MNHSIEILQQWLTAIHRLKIKPAVIKQMLEKMNYILSSGYLQNNNLLIA